MVFASIVDMTPTKGIEINQAFIFLAQRVEKLHSFSNLEWAVLRKKERINYPFGLGGFMPKILAKYNSFSSYPT